MALRHVNGHHARGGGAIEIAAISKHEGFKWIERRHFFPPEHNASD